MPNSEPAFPGCVAVGPSGDVYTSYNIEQVGLTKREYFAAMAMQGICSHPDTWGCGPDEIAIHARILSNALIEELNK